MDKTRIRLEGLFIFSTFAVMACVMAYGWYKLIGYVLSLFIK